MLAVGAGLTTAFVLHRPHGWFDEPTVALIAFGGAALLGALLPHAWWAWRRSPADGAHAAFAGSASVWATLAIVLALIGVGSGYLAVLASFGAGVALVATAWTPRRMHSVTMLVGWAIGALAVIQFGFAVIRLFIPMVGRMGPGTPQDPLIAVVIALPVLACAIGAMPAIHAAGRPAWTVLLVGVLTVLGVALSALGFPYSESEPKRILVEHVDSDRGSKIHVSTWDALAVDALDASALPSGLPRPSVTVTPIGERRVRLHIGPGTYHEAVIELPRARIAEWSLRTRPSAMQGDRLTVSLVGVEAVGYDLDLVVRGAEPASIVVDVD